MTGDDNDGKLVQLWEPIGPTSVRPSEASATLLWLAVITCPGGFTTDH
ncbi:unnamed protein product, partial [Nippostrongylus brasiliensis]|uniref:Uncharacterized protein n=1 Tax=Nippostrongylus brasiliensis TaxID=27835 RepID=A0A0N4YAR5_NIPBR